MSFQLGDFTSVSNPPNDIPSLPGRRITGALVSNTQTALFHPKVGPGMGYYLELTGAGSVTGAVVFQCADGSFAPEGVATDGAAETILNDIHYDGATQNGIRIPLDSNQTFISVAFKPGVVAGAVNFAFVQEGVR